MKKLKKILSILSAVMIMSACVTSAVYADEVTIGTTESTVSTNEMLTDLDEIAELLQNFGEECQIPSFKASVHTTSEETPREMVSIYWWGDNDYYQARYLVDCFIEEKNIDGTKVFGVPPEIYNGWFCDLNEDKKQDVRDCAYLASSLAKGEKLNYKADYNCDGNVNVRDAAVVAKILARK